MNYGYYLIRAIFVLLIQVLILQNIPMGKVNIYLYPMIIMLLPIAWFSGVVILIAFLYGLAIDLFYNSDALHAAALVFTAFARPYLHLVLEPRGGYEVNHNPTKASLGMPWFSRYTALTLFLHIATLSILQQLSLSWLTLGLFIFSFLLSWLMVMLYQIIFNPK
jgi:hypothetical protein